MADTTPTAKFGGCCEELRDAIAAEDFEPLITESDDGLLFMAVGLIDLDDDEPGMVDHPVFFCPFCGTKLQDRDTVLEKIGHGSDDGDD
ncbi:MAG: hypothetical protein ACFCUN_08220 [Hyphomicrobiaceae bacterium]